MACWARQAARCDRESRIGGYAVPPIRAEAQALAISSTRRLWASRTGRLATSSSKSGVDPVLCQNSADRLGGPPFVVVEDPALPFMALNSGIDVDHAMPFLDQLIVESLMIPFDVVMLRVLLHRVA